MTWWIPIATAVASALAGKAAGSDKAKQTPGILPEQREALNLLLGYARGGQRPYGGDFNIDFSSMPGWDALMGSLTGDFLGLGGEDALRGLIAGDTTDISKLVETQRKLADTAAKQAAGQVLAGAAKGGGRYSSSAAAAAAQAAGNVKAGVEAKILDLQRQMLENAKQRQIAALQLLSRVRMAQEQGILDAARLQAAAKQWQKGMEYEEFKRMYPDVYKMLLVIFGRNIDFYTQKNPSLLSWALAGANTAINALKAFGGGG